MRQAAPEAPKQAPVPLCLGVLMGFGLVRVIIQVADVGSVGEREREKALFQASLTRPFLVGQLCFASRLTFARQWGHAVPSERLLLTR